MRKRVLIVEDAELNRELLVQLFEDLYEIEVAADGMTAIEVAMASSPDLILMDIALPHLNGLDAARVIRRDLPGVPIVAVSSSVMPGDRERAIEAGCDDFVAKPIDDLHLVSLVAHLIEDA
jgi:two-component system, cell cycle response regulator DivK